MQTTNWSLNVLLSVIAVLLALLLVRPVITPPVTVLAEPARFDHVFIASATFLYKGTQGVLVMDRRNGNVWLFPRVNETFQDPLFLMRLQFEKIDQAPQ